MFILVAQHSLVIYKKQQLLLPLWNYPTKHDNISLLNNNLIDIIACSTRLSANFLCLYIACLKTMFAQLYDIPFPTRPTPFELLVLEKKENPTSFISRKWHKNVAIFVVVIPKPLLSLSLNSFVLKAALCCPLPPLHSLFFYPSLNWCLATCCFSRISGKYVNNMKRATFAANPKSEGTASVNPQPLTHTHPHPHSAYTLTPFKQTLRHLHTPSTHAHCLGFMNITHKICHLNESLWNASVSHAPCPAFWILQRLKNITHTTQQPQCACVGVCVCAY